MIGKKYKVYEERITGAYRSRILKIYSISRYIERMAGRGWIVITYKEV